VLAKRGQASLERAQKEPSSWTATTSTSSGLRWIVDSLKTPTMRRTLLHVEIQGRRQEYARIIERDNVWYVTEDNARGGKYRPFEYPFIFLRSNQFLIRADPPL